jgi:hypothetical protein
MSTRLIATCAFIAGLAVPAVAVAQSGAPLRLSESCYAPGAAGYDGCGTASQIQHPFRMQDSFARSREGRYLFPRPGYDPSYPGPRPSGGTGDN